MSSASCSALFQIGVFTPPGSIRITSTPCERSSRRSESLIPSSAELRRVVGAHQRQRHAAADRAHHRRSARAPRRSAGRNACVTAIWPIRLISSCWRSRSTGRNSSGAATAMPGVVHEAGERRCRPARRGRPRSEPASVTSIRTVRMPRASSRSASSSLRTAPTASKPSSFRWSDRGLADAGRGAGHEHGSGGHRGAAYSLASRRWKSRRRSARGARTRPTGPSPCRARRSTSCSSSRAGRRTTT